MVAFLPELYLPGWLLLAAGTALIASQPKVCQSLALALLMLCSGAIYATLSGQQTLSKRLPDELIKQDLLAIGVIDGLVRSNPSRQRFRFNIQQLTFDREIVDFSGPVILNCYRDCPPFQSGERWQMTLRLKPAHGTLNPGGFNYAQWLFSQQIRASGYVRAPASAVQQSTRNKRPSISRLRTKIHHFIQSHGLEYSGILSALAVGIRDDINEQQWQIFRRTGTAHLIAISGLHIGMVAAIGYFIANYLWRYSLLVASQIPAQTIARIAAILAASGYAALAGFALPTLRALLMLLAYFVLLSLRRNPGTLFSLGFVLLIVLLFNPLAPLGSGFWLSFTAVAAIALATSHRNTIEDKSSNANSRPLFVAALRWFKLWWRVQLGVFIGLLPLSLLFFQQVSLVSLAANFIAIPLMAMLVVPLVLLSLLLLIAGATEIATFTLQFADLLLSLLWPLLVQMSALPMAVYVTAAPSTEVLLLSMLSLLILLWRRLGPRRLLAMPGLLPLFLSAPLMPALETGAYQVHLLDVGQGLAILVQTREHNLVYDAGIRFSDGFDSGQAVVLPFMRQRGIKQLDSLIVSHDNVDHYGGVSAVLNYFPAKQRYSSAGFFKNTRACNALQRWQWDDVLFEFLHPQPGNQADGNNASCVLKISSAFGSILLSGDIEKAAETHIMQADNRELRNIDVLIAAHHGSKTSSSKAFLEVTKPQLALISAGYLNRFKHPHEKVIERYAAMGIPVMNTANSGWIKIEFNTDGIRATPWRADYRRYWLEPVAGHEPVAQKFLPGRNQLSSLAPPGGSG